MNYTIKQYFNYKKQLIFIILNKFTCLSKIFKYNSIPDSVITSNNLSFFEDPNFKKSYFYAVDFVNDDYRIPFRVHQAIWAISNSQYIDGEILELGTGKGFIMSAVLKYFENKQWFISKKIYLFDIFLKPNESGMGYLLHEKYYANSSKIVEEKFSIFKNVKIIEGDIYKTLRNNIPPKISFVHIDLNNSDVELFSINLIWNNLQNGAIILIDDYANKGHELQYSVWNSFAEQFNKIILTTPSGQGILIK